MARRVRWVVLLTLVLAALTPAGAPAAEPPWCGTPEPDAAANLDPSAPGAFPHIPYYAIGCTLRDIASRSDGRMQVQVIGKSATGRDMYGVVINRLQTRQEKRDYVSWLGVRALMLREPIAAQKLLRRLGDDVKVPVFIQGGIHGDEYEGVDAAIDTIEKFATTPYGTDPKIDAILSRTILVFNPIQNPDGRVAGRRQNGNGFDLNRDYLTQSQSETRASIGWMKKWLAPEMLDMHGYVTPTLIEATTKPHNPSIEYDNWLKWNQPRIDYNEAALNAIGQQVTRPINDWCPEGDPPDTPGGPCDDGTTMPGPDVAEGWDDWGPFYAPMYHQHIGLDSSTVEMCSSTASCGGRAGSRRIQNVVQQSTLEFVGAHRAGMFRDELVNYVRGDTDAPRPACCPDPFKAEFHNWMQDYPKAYVIPFGAGQRSDAEANRLIDWALFNDIEVDRVDRDYGYGSQTFEKGSYVIWMAQPRRGLADTALSLGVDISPRIQRLYAPPAAWSHGYLWGADTVTIPDEARFSPRTAEIFRPNRLRGGVERGAARSYTLAIDSPTAVRATNAVLAGGVKAWLAPGVAAFAADRATRQALADAGEEFGVTFERAATAPSGDPIDRAPRIAVLTGAVNQDVWSLRALGFIADPVSVATINTAPADPLAGYDVVFNTGGWPSAANATARARLQAFFASGGGYIGAGGSNPAGNGADFLTNGGQVTGLTPAFDSGGGDGYSGIVLWDNAGGATSPITGAYSASDTAIVDPPTWFTAVPSTMSVDARMATGDFFLSGLFPGAETSGAAGSAIVAHGTNTANTANIVVFANNPLYRADPEREWPMLGSAILWVDR